MSKKRQTRASCAEAAAILQAQASVCLDLAAKSREFWVAASLIDLARELQNRAHRDR
jgi:energy-coupling factor transporter transmembrane protein EcfT